MIESCKNLYNKYKEIVNYLLFGVLATVVNFIAYYVFAKLIGVDEVISNAIAWIAAVLFAYITNKIYVFNNRNMNILHILKEITSFIGCRLLSGIIEMIIFVVLVKVFLINDLIVKVINQIIVTILNYVFSKMIIFKKNKKGVLEDEKN